MFYSSGKPLKKLDADWTTLTAYGGSEIRQFRGKNNQMLLEQPEVEISLSHFNARGPIVLGLKTLRHMGIFVKNLMVYIETIDIHPVIQHRLACQQIKKGDEEYQIEYRVASEGPKHGEMCQPPAQESQVSIDMINQAQDIPDYISEGPETEYNTYEQWYHMHEPADKFMRYKLHLKI